ncbi:hypothetical protein [Streptomyces sp. MUM 16J]|uniref:hypothetical protein n=1 Tax=Streptomyces sp. MUM 16J TaxID=2791988 RepID=UPI001F0435DA|nr:hypothetical protein [Streptomyces sp. MUM 16J]MCH0555785.1 hypothetical protein [Streptomyces sp. MUM 16J]
MAPIFSDPPLPRRSESGTATRAVNADAGVLPAAMKQGCQTPTGLAIALDSACLLASPEAAAELEQLRAEAPRLRARVAELEELAIGKGSVDEDPIAYALTPKADGISRCTNSPQFEDPHDSPLHHTYRIGRDLPEVTP